MRIRLIEPRDNKRVAEIIRLCLAEYDCAGRMDTAWGDPYLDRFSEVYIHDNDSYWVAENDEGIVVAGVGIGPLTGEVDVCELQKMYCLPECRGLGIAQGLLDEALSFATKYYKVCYLETRDNMDRAKRFYEKNGFVHTCKTYGCTGHGGCDYHYIKNLQGDANGTV